MKLFSIKNNEVTKHIEYRIFGIKISRRNRISEIKAENEYLIDIINSIGADKIPVAKGELKEWQLECLDLMRTLDKICRENDIPYWLDFGTLLGAVRHKGFIPWDDDIDISMKKSDIDRLLPILKDYFKDSKYLVRERAITCNKYQIRIMNKQYNVGLDIFQVYTYPKSDLTTELCNKINQDIVKARKIFENKYRVKTMTKEEVIKSVNDISNIQKQFILPTKSENTQTPILFHGIDYHYDEKYLVMPYSEIFPLKEIEFEGYKFYVPNKYKEYLSHLWDNWQNIPNSIGTQEHFFKNYKNSNYSYKEGEN